jgi:hypothetical protein
MNDAVLDPEARLDALVRAAAASRRRRLLDHPETDELVAYALDALSTAEKERIEEHLALCKDCAQLVLDLRAIVAPPPERDEPASPALAREWDRLRDRLERRQARPAASGGPSTKTAWLLAASVLVALGLLAWDLSLRRSLERARQPRADLQLVDLAPVTRGAERSPEHPVEVTVGPGVGKVVLLLNLGDLRSFPRYGLVLLGPSGRIVWQAADALRGEDGTFLLEVPADVLAAPGLYHLRLDGRTGSATTRLADYAFLVVR